MFKNLLSLNVVAALLMSGAVMAQETIQEDQPQGEVPQTESGSELDLGESGPRIGEQYVVEEVGDWAITCLKTEAEKDPCLMRQALTGEEGQPIADISINRLPEGVAAVAGATVIVPLEVLVQAQLALSIDGAPGKRYDYHHCNPVGCVAQLGFTDGDVAAMKAGSSATLSLVSVLAPNQLLQIEISLSGFTGAYDKLSVN